MAGCQRSPDGPAGRPVGKEAQPADQRSASHERSWALGGNTEDRNHSFLLASSTEHEGNNSVFRETPARSSEKNRVSSSAPSSQGHEHDDATVQVSLAESIAYSVKVLWACMCECVCVCQEMGHSFRQVRLGPGRAASQS